MNRDEIVTKLHEIIKKNFQIEIPEQLNENDKLNEDLGIDSIMILQILVYIEEVFNVNIIEEEFEQNIFSTVGSLVTFILELKKK